MRRLFDQAQASRAGAAGAKVVAGSYAANALIDDMWRSAAYLYGQDKALTKGMTAAEAAAKGVEHARSAFMQWDTLTPLERSVIRSVFPFYSWANFVVRQSAQLVADHPWRVSVASNIANAEMEDLGSGLPKQLLDMFFIGDPDENGNVKGINLQVGNPFRDIGTMAGLAGFLTPWEDGGSAAGVTSQLNPILGSFLRSMGVDPQQGLPELYSDLNYDPVTGQLKTETPSMALGFLESILPQTRTLTALTGWNQEFRATAQRNPAAAGQMLLGSLGISTPMREVNVNEQAIKTENRRYRSMEMDRQEALKTGNWSMMDKWPGLAAYGEQMRALEQQGQLEELKVPDQGVSFLELAQRGVTGG
jgi:hypothetical protein